MKLSEAVQAFLAVKSVEVRALTLRNYTYVLSGMTACIGDQTLTRIKATDLAPWFDDLRARYADTTRANHLDTARVFWRWCVEMGYVERSPLVVRIKRPSSLLRERKALTECELDALLAVVRDDPHDYALLCFLVDTGCRANATCSVRICDLNLVEGSADVIEKGGKRFTATFSSATIDALSNWLAVRPEVDHDYVFMSGWRRPLDRSTLYRRVRRLGECAGIDGLHPHRLRHTTSIRFTRAGAPLEVTAGKLGHADTRTTARFYQRGNQDDVRAYTERLAPGKRSKGIAVTPGGTVIRLVRKTG